MTVLLPPRRAIKLIAPLCLAFVGCATEPESEKPDLSTAIDQAADVIATGAVRGGAGPVAQPVVAEIMDIVDGGASGTWAVAVRFPNGVLNQCVIEVTDTRSGKLIIRDEVPSSDEESLIHETQFQYKGRATNLSVRVIESSSGSTLATAP